MKIELNVVGLTQHLDFRSGAVTCVALVQSDSGDVTELPVSAAFAERLAAAFAERLAAQHAAETPRGLTQLQGVPVPAHLRQPLPGPMHSSEIEVVSQGLPAVVVAIINAVEENDDYQPTDSEFELLARAGIDLVSMVQTGVVIPGSRSGTSTAEEPREFGMEATEGSTAPSLGSLFGSDDEDTEKEMSATKKAIADLKSKARQSPRAPRTVPHDEAGNPVVEQKPRAVRKGSSSDDLFGQG